jgi:myo-inositol 2-dehydrogenase / D-chiro-inositol 1-dehydrogenase
MTAQSRRSFIGTAAAVAAMGFACGKSKPSVSILEQRDTAPGGSLLTAGLIGCGGRGKGAALNYINAGPNLEVTALGDVFQDRVDDARKSIMEEGHQTVPEDRCFVGFNAFQKVIDSGVDVILLATPPHFRPEHFAAAVNADKHVFTEKPVAVDPAGVLSIIETAGQAKTKGLTVVSGTCYRHQKQVLETYRRVAEGAIGEILSARCYYNVGQLWYSDREEGWSDMECQIRDWVNWNWLSGDHIVEQHVHNLDTIAMFLGEHPVKAVGFGSRMRRVTGDQYDNFSIDFEYESGLHLSSMCRQIDGCHNNVSDYLVGTKGATNCHDTIFNQDGSVMWKFEVKEGDKEPNGMYDQEHIDMVTAIRTSEPLNEAAETAESTLTGIMGRESAYTGKEIVRSELLKSEMRLGPETYALGPADMEAVIPIPGKGKS